MAIKRLVKLSAMLADDDDEPCWLNAVLTASFAVTCELQPVTYITYGM
jgi:hypothetical protein